MFNIRYLLSYLFAMLYQFFGTLPHFDNVIIPQSCDKMSWWHFTHFLCLLSNKLYPHEVPNGMLTSSMILAIKQRACPKMTYEEFVSSVQRDGFKQTRKDNSE